MARTHFSRLAYLPGQGAVSICRHGLVHLTWENLTLRLQRSVFMRLGRLLERGLATSSSVPLYDQDLSVRSHGGEFHVAVASIELTLSAETYLAFRGMIRQALQRLETLLASGGWEEDEEEEPLALLPWEELDTPSFSLN